MSRVLGKLKRPRYYGRPGRSFLVGTLALLIAPFVVSSIVGTDYAFDLGTQTAIYALAIMGLSMLYGWAGQISLAHAVFFGMGAYATAYMRTTTETMGLGGQGLELLVVIAVGIVAGVVVGLPALRVSGLQLAIVTMGFALVFQWALIDLHSLTGGTQGRFVGWFEIGDWSTADARPRFVIALVLATLGGFLMMRLRRTPLGRAMTGIRDSEFAAQSVGVVPATTKLWAFVLSAVYASVAGWMFAYYIFQVTPGNFQLFDNIYFLTAVIIGGRGLLLGCWLGAAYLVLVPDLVRNVGDGNLYPVVSGLVLIAIVLLAPAGIADLMVRLQRSVRERVKKRFARADSKPPSNDDDVPLATGAVKGGG